jgi:hypothetical protein
MVGDAPSQVWHFIFQIRLEVLGTDKAKRSNIIIPSYRVSHCPKQRVPNYFTRDTTYSECVVGLQSAVHLRCLTEKW